MVIHGPFASTADRSTHRSPRSYEEQRRAMAIEIERADPEIRSRLVRTYEKHFGRWEEPSGH
jgi:hypothetical protein